MHRFERLEGTSMRAFLIFALLLCGTASFAQLAPSPDAPPVSNAPAQPEDETAAPLVKVQVSLVDIVFTVKDKSGALVPHLTTGDCKVYEDKVEQQLKSFVAEANLPLTLGLVIDTSYSQKQVLQLEQDAGSQFLNRVLRKKDQAFLLSVDVNVDLLQDLTNDPRRLSRALNSAKINAGFSLGSGPVPTQGAPRGTVLYDAVYLAANEKLAQEQGRKALILLTDGEDQGSRTKLAGALEAAQRSNTIVYVILIADVQSYLSQGFGYSGFSAMKKLADESGGRVINVGNNGKKLAAAFDQIEDELRTQYVTTYTSTNKKQDGGFRKIAVECKGEGLKVMTRKGYYAPSDESNQ
jgi:VWFA-related protein